VAVELTPAPEPVDLTDEEIEEALDDRSDLVERLADGDIRGLLKIFSLLGVDATHEVSCS